MGKIVTINESDLLKIKEGMVGSSNTASHNTVCVNEARPEVDEFELGQESDNPPVGGNYCHVNEANVPNEFIRNAIKLRPSKLYNWAVIDLIDIGRIPRYFQKRSAAYDYYKWLKNGNGYDRKEYYKPLIINLDKELMSLNESYNNVSIMGDMDKIDYIDYVPHDSAREEGYTADNITEFEPYYELTCYGADGEIIFYGELTLNELFDYFPDKIIHALSNRQGRKVSEVEYRIDDILSWNTTPNDINDVEEVNAIAKRIQPGGPSSYILTDGDIVSFPDHIQITTIDGMTPSKFVGLGNIRVGKNVVELSKEPNREQLITLKDFLKGEDEIYLDIVKDEGRMYPGFICSAAYHNTPIDRIINDIIYYFQNRVKPQGNMKYESKEKYKHLIENINFEVNSSDISLSSFKKKDSLAPIWDENRDLNPRIRLKLLDIADDFWKFVNLTWVKPNGIILTGSICNFNWSNYSDIDLHLIVDFDEIDEKTEFVRDYLDAKKNEWNNEHEGLKIFDFPIELYVQDLGEMPKSGGIYDLEQNEWLKRPNKDDIKSIGLNKFSIKDRAANIMTIIDDMYDALNSTSDSHEVEQIGDDAKYLWKKVKAMRKKSLEINGENGNGNVVYKILRRARYLEKLWKLSTLVYDRTNSINESIVDGNSDMFAMAIERFGVTNDIRECGYILPNGMMLDFTGRHTLNKGTDSSHLAGRRGIDHRDISDVGWSIDGNTKNFDLSMEDFIRLGAIRTHVSRTYSSINLFKKPTPQQLDIISRIVRFANGCIDVEIGDGNESLSYGEYDEVKPNVVIAQINRFFDDGINLMENESIEKFKHAITLLKEEVVADGNSEHNPYAKRWKAERKALKDFICNYGKIMTSKENGKQYKCYYDKVLSQLIGYNYCICLQWDPITMKPSSTLYIRALDKFTNRTFQAQYDMRGQDNIRGNGDDINVGNIQQNQYQY